MKFSTLLCLVTLFTAPAFVALPANAGLPDPATKSQVPPIAFVQGMIWKRLDLADFTLNGVVRCDKTKKNYPIILRTKGHELVYEFTNQPLQIRVQLNPGAFTIQKRSSSSGAWSNLSSSEMTKTI